MDSQYRHGGDIFGASRRLNLEPGEIYDFSANINPLGPSPKAMTAIRENLDLIRHYPDPHCTQLRRALARHLGVTPGEIVLGNGAAEIIYLLARVLQCRRGLVPAPTFIEYSEAVEGNGGSCLEIHLDEAENFALSGSRIKTALPEADIVFLCNPNNPTGRLENRSTMQALIHDAQAENVTVVVDEAFMDFVADREQYTVIPLIHQYPNLIVLYSMTKFFGLPGLRLGALVGNQQWVSQINAIKDPWNVNTLAQIAGVASLADEEHATATGNLVRREREFLSQSLAGFSHFKVFPSHTNYLLVKICQPGLTSPHLTARIARSGVLVRDCSTFSGLGEAYIRVAVKTREENMVLLEALRKALQ